MKLNGIVALMAISSLGVLMGCVKPDDTPAPTAQSEAAARPAASDDKLLASVRETLAAEPLLKGEKIEVTVKDGTVALSGTVATGAAKMKAEDLARSVPEVFGVDAEKLFSK